MHFMITQRMKKNPGGAKINDWHTRHEDQAFRSIL